MEALIIAAGRGSRLREVGRGLPKILVPVLGVPIIDRTIATLRNVGIRDVVVTVGHQGPLIRTHLGDGARVGVRVQYAENGEYDCGGNARSVLAARDLLNGEFLLLMGDHLVDERIAAAMVEQDVAGSVLIAIDRAVDPGDATKVYEEHGRVADIGKEIARWNAIDTGVFRCSAKFLDELEGFVAEGTEELADAISRTEAHTFDLATIDPYVAKLRKPVPPWWVNVNTPEDLAAAERVLVESASKNASDALAHWVHRPIENALVARIARRSRITPNQLSLGVNILAYTVTVLFASGRFLAGSLLSFVVGIADGLDGKLARVKQQVSRVGSLEHAFDMLYEYSWMLALAWGIHRDDHDVTPLLLAGIAVAVVAFYRAMYDQYGKQAGHSLDDAAGFDRRFRRIAGRRNLYNIWILVAVLAGEPIFALWAIATHAAVTGFVYAFRTTMLLARLDRTSP